MAQTQLLRADLDLSDGLCPLVCLASEERMQSFHLMVIGLLDKGLVVLNG